MRVLALVCLSIVGVALAAKVGVDNQIPGKHAPSGATVDRRKGEVDANFAGLRGAKRGNLRSPMDSDLKAGRGDGTIKTGRNDKLKVSRVKGPDGRPTNTAVGGFQGSRGKKNQVNAQLGKGGGVANTGKRHPSGTWSGRRKSDMEADVKIGRKDVHAVGNGKGEFNTEGHKGGTQQIVQRSSSSSRSSANSAGGLMLNQKGGKGAKHNGNYNYALDSTSRGGGHAQLTDAKQQPGRSGVKLDCNSPKVGETGCVNQNGKKTPTAIVDEEGHARLTKDGTSLARVNVAESGRKGSKVFTTNVEGKQAGRRKKDPVYLSKVESFKQTDCYREITKKNDPDPNDVKFTKRSMKFTYNTRSQSGATVYSWPDCFEVTGEILLGKNIDVKDLAVEFQARINPLGDVSCADVATCGRGSCYYCDICNSDNAKLSVLKNADNDDTCATKSGNRPQRYKLSATFCPPPPQEKFPLCTSFSRPYTSTYWTSSKDESIIARVLIWERPKNTQKLTDRFFYCIEGGSGCSLGIDFRTQLKLSYLAEQGLSKGISKDVPDEVLHQYYIRQQLGRKKADFKERLLSCEKGVMDYDVAGSKVGGKFLIEAGDVLTKKSFGLDNAFVEAPCPEIQSLETQEYNRAKKDWKARGSNKGSDGGLLSSLGGLTSGLGSLGGLGGGSSGGGIGSLFG